MIGGGATIADSSSNGDHSLLRLNNAPPNGAIALGFNSASVSGSNGTSLYRISHPATAPQAFSSQAVNTSAGTCTTLPRGEFIYSTDIIGGTEGGSGSAICNVDGQVVGQPYGACGTNVNDACDSASNATVDGAMSAYFSSVASFLDPGGNCTPSGNEICTGGVDEDCDNQIDCNDSDCSSDPACQTSCGGTNAQCSSNSECCSGTCKVNGRCR